MPGVVLERKVRKKGETLAAALAVAKKQIRNGTPEAATSASLAAALAVAKKQMKEKDYGAEPRAQGVGTIRQIAVDQVQPQHVALLRRQEDQRLAEGDLERCSAAGPHVSEFGICLGRRRQRIQVLVLDQATRPARRAIGPNRLEVRAHQHLTPSKQSKPSSPSVVRPIKVDPYRGPDKQGSA
jgi:hypothetical protein